MALLNRFAILVACATGCYAPEARDCTVSCSAPMDCVDGQRCTNGFCVFDESPACPVTPNPETPDAPPASPMTALHLVVMGHGRIEVKDISMCDMDCRINVPRGVEVRLIAIELDHEFDKWTSLACANQSNDCRITPTTAGLEVVAKFK